MGRPGAPEIQQEIPNRSACARINKRSVCVCVRAHALNLSQVETAKVRLFVCFAYLYAAVCGLQINNLHSSQRKKTESSINIHICLHTHTMVMKYTVLLHIILTHG